MNITIIATGSRGDVQPYIALGKGLSAAGHTVRLATHANFEALVTAHDLDFWLVKGDVQAVAQSAEMRERLQDGNFLAIMSRMAREAERAALDMAEGSLAACHGADLVLGGLGGEYMGMAVAEKLGLPFVPAYLVPFTPTGAFPSVLAPGLPGWLQGAPNRLTHHLTRQIMWQSLRRADRAARERVLELAGAPFWGPYGSASVRGMPTLVGISPHVVTKPPDWGNDVHLTGYWFLEAEEAWTPPPALRAFLEAGPPPVYIGFGSMSDRHPEETAALVLAAVTRAGQRAVLMVGWGGMRAEDLPASVYMLDAAPHDWLFPRMTAVVHHGGAGTTAAGLRAGVPSLIVPYFGDQPYWGRRVAALGVGPAPIPRKRLTVEKLTAAIETAATDATMRRRAADLGAVIRAEDGVARAAQVLGSLAHLPSLA